MVRGGDVSSRSSNPVSVARSGGDGAASSRSRSAPYFASNGVLSSGASCGALAARAAQTRSAFSLDVCRSSSNSGSMHGIETQTALTVASVVSFDYIFPTNSFSYKSS